MIRLNVTHAGESVERIFNGDTVTVGRSRQCDVVIADLGYLSRRHCQITLLGTHCEVVDLSSRNGVQVNGIFFKRGIVEVGDEVQLGDLVIELLAFGPDEEEPEEVRPCMECGFLLAADEMACPRCSGSVALPRRSRINRNHLQGYVLRRKIGAGGMGIVFEAMRKSDRATTAIKILKPHLARDPSYLARFVEETRVLTLLEHPNIVQIYGRGAEKGLTFIDMELVSGISVRELIRNEGVIPEDKALRIIWKMVRALDFAARKKVIHGDVKPSNFLLDGAEQVKLCDFGLARFHRFSRHTRFAPESSERKGTAAYAAPERFLEGAKPTVAGDIYSLGVSLFQMVTGELPFGTNRAARARSSVEDRANVPDPTLFNPKIRQATGMLIERMMRVVPPERYPSYGALEEDLTLLL